MKKLNTSPISGTQELLPSAQATFDQIKTNIVNTYHRHGYLSIEAPILERSEILFAKAGGDTEKQIYKAVKTGETSVEDTTEALRFDHTVPLARYVVEHESDLAFPFKVTQCGQNFRGERAQKGRFREFYQCDADVIGRNDLPLFYDSDVIITLLEAFRSFGLDTPVIARISNRKILGGFLAGLNLQEKTKDIYDIIDHSEKVPLEKTIAALEEIGLDENKKEKVLSFMEIAGERSQVVETLKNLGVDNPTMSEGISELDQVLSSLETAGYRSSIKADLKIIRGLDYYTGTVFEFILPEYPEVGSVTGGGRYENLTEYFSDQKYPGVGGSIGLNRLFYVLNEKNLLKNAVSRPVDYAIIPISEAELPFTFKTAADLREKGSSVTIVGGDKKLADRLKYAAKIATKSIVIGENEASTGTYEIKELK